MSIIDTLRSSELFGGLSADHLRKVSELCRGDSYQEGVTIFKEGGQAAELYITTEGRVVLEIELRPVADSLAIPAAVEVITKGGCFGWSALVQPYVYTSSARCITNCTVLAIKGDILRRTMADDPRLGYEVMKKLTEIVALRLTHIRLRLTTGLGLVLLGKELELAK